MAAKEKNAQPDKLKKVNIAAAPAAQIEQPLFVDLRELIISARQQVAQVVNSGLTMLYWQVGNRIRRDILKKKRAEYGAEILQALSAKLSAEFGRGFSSKSLRHMVRFAEVFQILQLSQRC